MYRFVIFAAPGSICLLKSSICPQSEVDFVSQTCVFVCARNSWTTPADVLGGTWATGIPDVVVEGEQ